MSSPAHITCQLGLGGPVDRMIHSARGHRSAPHYFTVYPTCNQTPLSALSRSTDPELKPGYKLIIPLHDNGIIKFHTRWWSKMFGKGSVDTVRQTRFFQQTKTTKEKKYTSTRKYSINSGKLRRPRTQMTASFM